MVLASLSVLSLVCAATAEFNVVRHVSHAPRSLEPAVIPEAQFVVPITSTAPRRKSKKSNLASLRASAAPNNTAVLEGADFDQETFTAIVDTGSSDTWLINKDFKCFNLTGFPESTETCGFGSAGFDTNASSTFQSFPKSASTFREFLSGGLGFDTVSVGGLTVTQQEIGVPDLAAWNGDGVNSGLIGLAYSGLTSAFNTTDPTKASSKNHIPYDPFFFTAVKQGAVSNPFFSLALNRGALVVNATEDPNLGFIAFGGMPPVDLDKTAVTVPVQGYSASTGEPSSTDAVFFYYTVDVDAYTFPGSTKVATSNNNTILDSGTTLNLVPTKVAKAYNAQFVPKATLDRDSGLYFVDCNATVPAFSVTLGGKCSPSMGVTRSSTPARMTTATPSVSPVPRTAGRTRPTMSSFCALYFSCGRAPLLSIFCSGDVFLHNVVSTFNIQTNELTVTRRKKY
ncbi:aspartic peptidase domain-containing protein [Mycena olivaceomarginata]|nr:aspartic peptidase domain-containing protein [Mycena olivaceomarginata]